MVTRWDAGARFCPTHGGVMYYSSTEDLYSCNEEGCIAYEGVPMEFTLAVPPNCIDFGSYERRLNGRS